MRTGDPTGARWASAATIAAEPSGGGEGGGEGVVVEQRRRPRHGGDAVRRLGDRVEHGDRRRVGGHPGGPAPGRPSTGSSMRTAARRARSRPAGVPFTLTSSSCTPVAPSARPDPRSGTERRTGSRPPGPSSSARSSNGETAESVGASPSSASRSWPSVVSGLPRWMRTCRPVTGSGPSFTSVPVTVSVAGPSAVTTRGLMSVSTSRSPPVAAAAATPVSSVARTTTTTAAKAATGLTPCPPAARWRRRISRRSSA